MIIYYINHFFYYSLLASILYAILWFNYHSFLVLNVVLAQSIVVYCLKESFRIERQETILYDNYIGHSFPSLYATNITFICIYFSWVFFKQPSWTTLKKSLKISLSVSFTIISIYTRYILHYNTLLDIFVGIAIGCLFATAFIKFQNTQLIIKYE